MCGTTVSQIENLYLGMYKNLALLRTLEAVVYILETNVRPEGTALAECCNIPTRKKNFPFFDIFLPSHSVTICFVLANFFTGRRASILQVSRIMSKNSSVVDGPDTMSTTSGTPSILHSLMIVFGL